MKGWLNTDDELAAHAQHSEGAMSVPDMNRTQTTLNLQWADGVQGTYHYIWLRDNCSCSECGDKSGGHRYLELNAIPSDITPKQVTVNARGQIEIVWTPDEHLTVYESDWLRHYSRSQQARQALRCRPVLWDAALTANPPNCRYSDVLSSDRHRLTMLEHLRSHGFCLLREVPVEHDEVERVARLVGYIRETHYGRVFDLVSTKEQRILAQTSHAIRPHHDELFRDPTPGILIMHCLIASEDGRGESVLVDGFKAAQTLASDDSTSFDLLTRVPVAHHRVLSDGVDDVALRAVWRTIALDDDGQIVAVRINERTMAPLDLPEDEILPTYAALRKLIGLVYDPSAAVRFRLEAGDAVLFDNHRVLHARMAFSGTRHIRQCHVDRDEFLSRLETLDRRVHDIG